MKLTNILDQILEAKLVYERENAMPPNYIILSKDYANWLSSEITDQSPYQSPKVTENNYKRIKDGTIYGMLIKVCEDSKGQILQVFNII